jgi:hypothetical protein
MNRFPRRQVTVFTSEGKEMCPQQQPISRCPVMAGLQTLLRNAEVSGYGGYNTNSSCQQQIRVSGDLHIQLIPSQPQFSVSEEGVEGQGVSFVLRDSCTGQLSSSSKPYFITRLSLSDETPVEQVKVQLSGDVLLVRCGDSQKTRHILTLPQSVRKDLLQVKLSKSGDLVVFAPQKFNSQEELTRPFGIQQQLLEIDQLLDQPHILSAHSMYNSIPIHPSTSCSTSLFSDPETDSCCEFSRIQEMANQYARLWQKIFSPSLVVAKLVPSRKYGRRPTMALHIKVVDFQTHGREVEPVRVHPSQPNVLIVESEDQCSPREIAVPQWLKVCKLAFHHDEESGVLRIKLPFSGKAVCSRHVPKVCIILTGKVAKQSNTVSSWPYIFMTKSPQQQTKGTRKYQKLNCGWQC